MRWFSLLILWLLIVQIAFYFIQQNQAESLLKSIHGQLRQELEISNFHFISRNLSDLESAKTIKCTKLTILKPEKRIILDLTYKNNCLIYDILLNGSAISKELKALNGDIYLLDFFSVNQVHFFLALWLIRIFGFLQILSFWWFHNSRLKMDKEIYETKVQISEKIVTLASQVSHDIRSPLSALNMMMGGLEQLPEDKRTLIRNAVQRINDIANNLLEQSRAKNQLTTNGMQTGNDPITQKNQIHVSTQLLAPIIDTIISEKRIQYRDKINIHIEADLTQAYGLFIKANAIELKRVISNLVNNSVEAFSEAEGNITVYLRHYGNNIHIIIQDNGKGIPTHIISKLGEKGITHGKDGSTSGSGLGIYHAKETVQSFGGEFKIESKEGVGTTIYLIFPKAESPIWFVDELKVSQSSKIIVLDDDQAIHNLWDGRFQSLRLHEQDIVILHNSSLDTVTTESTDESELLLVDYEFLGSKKNGLDFIIENQLENKAILVTSRYEEKNVLERCQKHGIRLIPKNMAAFIPIQIQKQKIKYDAVLLDDDSIIHMTWKMEAEAKKKNILVFSNSKDLKIHLNEISKESPIFVDVNLGPSEPRGEVIAEELYNHGFKNIYLATGYDSDQFNQLTWLKGIVGKEPRF